MRFRDRAKTMVATLEAEGVFVAMRPQDRARAIDIMTFQVQCSHHYGDSDGEERIGRNRNGDEQEGTAVQSPCARDSAGSTGIV